MKKGKRCICEQTFDLNGEIHVEWPDPDCPAHGLRDTAQNHPLMKYARRLDLSRLYVHATPGYFFAYRTRQDRLETPREVQRRLFAEGKVPRGLYLLSNDPALD